MHIFTDTAGRRHTITINVFAVKRCRALLDVDLYGLVSGGFESLGKLLGDPVTLVDVLFVLCEPSITDEEFGKAMGGDVLEHATTAFMEELTDFFPEPQRTGLKKVLEKTRKFETALASHASTVIDELDVETLAQEEIAEAKAKAVRAKALRLALSKSIDSSGTLPEFSESILGPSPSES